MLDSLTRRLGGVFARLRRKGRLSEDDVAEMLREVRVALLEADVNFQVAKEFMAKVKEKAVGEELYGSLNADQTLIRIVRDELTELLGGEETRFQWSPAPPTVVLMCGLQGSGKTTTCAKLALWLQRQGKRPMLAACDLQRPAAVHQLEVLGEQVGVPVFAEPSSDPPSVARHALERCRHLMLDVLVVDTAGRLTIDEPLMAELGAVSSATKPSEVLLVLDSTTGQEAVNVANAFHERLALTGAIFTKLDGDTRGGAVLSVRQATGVPVRFIGIGEQVEALDIFYPDRMAERILGFGDILGIIEKAEQVIEKDQAEALQGKLRSGGFDFDDMLSQIGMMRKMGPLKNVMKMIPGLAQAIPEEAMGAIDDRKVDRLEAIMLSMTRKERANPDILNGSRRKRIAAGSGTSVEEVNNLVKQLYEMRKTMKQVGKMQRRMKKFGKRR
ncbi:MAG TPA: signal recognition particle protein [Fimbriimonadaceae bacterium]|nr:signal recognition particle protein [Fimbriimonadaceae bacterium]HRJ97552.1 signal recognition particle protein [Fimbriimonadaceae bacterium]